MGLHKNPKAGYEIYDIIILRFNKIPGYPELGVLEGIILPLRQT